jgi:hypothetical protein
MLCRFEDWRRTREIADRITFADYFVEADYEVVLVGDGTAYVVWLQVGKFEGVCNVTGKSLAWRGRKWPIEPEHTEGEIVRTALKAVLTAVEHEAREQFLFDGKAIFDPHQAGVA